MAFNPDIVLIGDPQVCEQFCQTLGVDPVKNYLQISVKGVRYKVNLQQMRLTEFRRHFSIRRRSLPASPSSYTTIDSLSPTNRISFDLSCSHSSKVQMSSTMPHGFIVLFDADDFSAQYYLPSVIKETLGTNSAVDTLLIGSCVNKESAQGWEETLHAVSLFLPLFNSTLVDRGDMEQYKTSFSRFLKHIIECNLHLHLGSFNWEWQRQKARHKRSNCHIL
ncbi:uncharacterized protein LOC134848477 [Symsagittifera roscoffensis]|uniref:uncharacterized protein LOC134848477 n=1 Tax=Symsagittifera roscoffensis TaxID=84072 RepID=UPI00307C6C0C